MKNETTTQEQSQHTPGPWKSNGSHVYAQHNPGGNRIAIADVSGEAFSSIKANAKLIAAAPETKAQRDLLLEALKNLRKEIRSAVRFDVKKHYSLMVADVAADKAVARAEGRES